MEPIKSELILRTFDGTMKKLNLTPECDDSKVEFQIKYYNDEDILTEASIIFEGVVAIDFEIIYFDSFSGSELFGFYEIFDSEAKIKIIEKIFNNRLKGYLYNGDYNYDPNEENNMLNYRKPLNELFKQIEKYHLYQQQTLGGIFYILALNYKLLSDE